MKKNRFMTEDALALVTTIGIVVLLSVISVLKAAQPQPPPLSYFEYEKLVSMSTGETGGVFFLGCGPIRKKQYYFYYTRKPDGALYRAKFQASAALIYDDAPPSQSYVVYTKVRTGTGIGAFAYSKAEFHIPKNSIKEEFKLN